MRVFAFVAILLIGAAADQLNPDRYAEDAADMHALTELQGINSICRLYTFIFLKITLL